MISIKTIPNRKTSTRFTITVPGGVFDALVFRSNEEGRSVSNLAAYLIEQGLEAR
jgi:hypothetical protein